MDLPERIFRAYDIRGIVDDDLTEENVRQIGLGYGSMMRSEGRGRVAVGHDIRDSSPGFASAVSDGLRAAGVDVIMVGSVPTPLLYYAVAHLGADGGIMVTGSHNPIQYNGLKITRGIWPIWGKEIEKLREIALAATPAGDRGGLQKTDVVPAYREELQGKFHLRDGFKVAIDCGNGTAGPIVLPLFADFGIEVEGLYTEPDGSFPNHLPDPEVPEYMEDLCELVRSSGASLGLGFDGDADRVGLIDERGVKKSADHLLLVLARYLLEKEGRGKVILDVKCSDFLLEDIARRGGTPILWKTGHSIIKEKMREEGAIIAGELSGHICVARDYYGFDDAFYAALLTLQILSEKGGRLSELFEDIPESFYTPEIKVGVSEDEKFGVVSALVAAFKKKLGGDRVNPIDGLRVTWADGWLLIRASNTTPNLTLRIEGRTEEARDRIARVAKESLAEHPVDTTRLDEWVA
ncbi:MAG: phosphomannomutase/phosphoglucomutase [Planctomycetota bacterium]